ncbi:MAG: S8 family serine peptidase [Bacteroidota bacterium]
MRLRTTLLYLFLILSCFLIPACKKPATPETPQTTISINKSVVTLAKDQPFLARLIVTVQYATPGESTEVTWSSENPRIASVDSDGLVKPQGAGETNILATLVSGKGVAKCKVIITDGYDYKYRIVLKDKGVSGFSVNTPGAFLSSKAIARRQKYNIPVDESDLPISPDYIKTIQNIGGIVVAKSKWLNTVSVHCTDQFLIDKYKALPFVKDVVLVWQGKRAAGPTGQYVDNPQAGSNDPTSTPIDYGAALDNINTNNGQVLHTKGFKGAGIDIAVIDAGFINLKANPMFKNAHIKGAKSFVYENNDPYSIDSHGVWVTSCMAANKPGYYVGTAPEANYWLLRSEDESTEHPIEEDYWVNAIEYADSAGVDIVNSSLSYTVDFYSPADRYTFQQMDGQTAFATRGANMAINKGIFIVNSAGNDRSWVGTPADAPGVLTTGSVNSKLGIDEFSAWGITVDGRMKPDVVARGGSVNVINVSGTAEIRSGTSYASPIMCGLVACLWQAFPKLTNKELLGVIRKSGNRADTPIIPYGYGIADMQKAMDLAKVLSDSK